MYQLIEKRASVLHRIREYFDQQGVFEVEVPLLGRSSVTDPHLSAISAQVQQQAHYLQTSPEFFMKRLLAEGSGDIYYLGKAFRNDESGKLHNPEFTMLEWYRTEFNDEALMDDVGALLHHLAPLQVDLQIEHFSYAEVFEKHVGLNPHTATVDELAAIAKQKLDVHFDSEPKATWLDLLFSHLVEKHLQNPTFITDYTECQAALAKVVNTGAYPVAKRFELFWKGVELANGYWELTDAKLQRERFVADNKMREAMGRPPIDIDEKFIESLEKGLPDCAGVALGVDRLMMCLFDENDISHVMPFPSKNL
ncbi:Elongation factor P--(R)-beta-lysine ligase [Thalassocella blandensis]|nr:Elongation factor P--(R)-beta-lysine ligase [Thalassocella blandensis]